LIIADRKFTINSPRERIWEYIIMALMRCMSFEGMQFADERSFSAILRMKMGFITLPVRIKMEIIDIVKLESIVTTLQARGLGGLVWFNQKATFTLTTVDESKTEVASKMEAEGMAFLLRTLLLWKVKGFARETLDSLEVLLKQWTA